MNTKLIYALVSAAILVSQSAAANVAVYVAYAENERPAVYFPDPWLGSPDTTFLGYPGTAWDTGAVLILNTGTTDVVLSRGVRIDGFQDSTVYQLWDNLIPAAGLSIAPGKQVILAQTGAQDASGNYTANPCIRGVTPGATCFSNFDSSDTPVNSQKSTATPKIHLTLNGVAQTFTDSGQILNTGGFDYGNDYTLNESTQWRLVGTTGPTVPAGTGVPQTLTPFDVTTYHYDAQRTGLNSVEAVLTPERVGSSAFSKLNTVSFNGHVDAQPLVVSAQTWSNWGHAATYPHDVVYVATANNDIFAIDGLTGQILKQRNFGAPITQANLPGACSNNAATVGISSTPVIDAKNQVLYFISYALQANTPVYQLHKINLFDLTDNVAPTTVSGSSTLSDGTKVTFNAAYQRQRPGLLLANGNIYAGFGSFCDLDTNYSRGWILGWNAANLNALPAAALMDKETSAQAGNGLNLGWTIVDYLSSIWMSGYGLAADSSGNVYAQTGNSNGKLSANLPDSVVKISANLATVADYFTPSNFAALDAADEDRGSAGVMVVPDQPNGLQVAVAPGKDGRLFLLNRNKLGKFTANGPDVPPYVNAGACWCGPNYMIASDGQPRIVSTGGNQVQTWFLPATANGTLTADAVGAPLPSGSGDPGFMSSVSTYGTLQNSAVIWSVSRSVAGRVFLQALDGTADAGGGSVTDKAGRVWSFGTSARNAGEHNILINGASTSGWGSKLFIGNDGLAYHLNAYGQYYTGDGVSWSQIGTPPKARPASLTGTVVTPTTGGSVTDANGNIWSFGASVRNPGEHNLVVNGVPTAIGYGVKIVIATDGTAWHYNAYNQWYTGDGVNWTQHASGPSLVVPSRLGTQITVANGGSLTDATGNVWSFGTATRNPGERNIIINGNATSGWAVTSGGPATASTGRWAAQRLIYLPRLSALMPQPRARMNLVNCS